jgi:small subunit ribosomal protein S9
MTAQPELRWHAVGRRKTSVARVYLVPGSGKWSVNGRTLGDYFPRQSLVQHIQQPFQVTDTLGAFDVKARVGGGGQAGQAGAVRLGVARALVLADETHRRKLRAHGSGSSSRSAERTGAGAMRRTSPDPGTGCPPTADRSRA